MEKLIIIGSGPSGLTAAIYAARANLAPLVLAGPEPGGQLVTTTLVENWPGSIDGIMGPDLVLSMQKQAEKFGARIVFESVKSANFSQKPFKISTDSKTYEAEAIIIASGARARTLGLPNEKELIGKGVHTCATCDAAFYKGKEVIVVGGGDSAMEESNFITKFAKKVHLVHRKNTSNASKIMQERAKNNHKIEFIWNSEIKEYLGKDKLEAVKLFDNQTNKEKEMKIDGVFLAIGHIPNTEAFQGQLKLGKFGYIEPKNEVFTEIPGVFVAGDVSDWRYRQAVTAAGFGCMAALEAEKYLAGKE
ncbi:MAG: thioredoxin-disulfide reductase [Candidatus Komeilibacteria bacterium RIFCSPLOWO2_01_FULL_45_10]|uniref:Thioredoxin reductase n=1 Tax=Candidatus Komeilibacteria bacterium RIFCSPLOWO2_01_FULL_45_10 TaxID=1798550 RepID=A0A1G2BLE8_9BACT|nr:MAG: thioredoxin-disulfide reductase [Candidatus Komeilibacteria bacterium RIFCSPLOWO2_01_FULL_45_10]